MFNSFTHGDKFFDCRYEDYLPKMYQPTTNETIETKVVKDTTYEFKGYADYLK